MEVVPCVAGGDSRPARLRRTRLHSPCAIARWHPTLSSTSTAAANEVSYKNKSSGDQLCRCASLDLEFVEGRWTPSGDRVGGVITLGSIVGTVVVEKRGSHKAALSLATSSAGVAAVRATMRISFSLTST